jgi:hypothetical protein
MKSDEKRNYIRDGIYFSEKFIKYKGIDFGNYTQNNEIDRKFGMK